MTVYLDCNATTPIEPAVQEHMLKFFRDEFGNAGSRTHEFGARAKEATERAREQVAQCVGAQREEIIFTSGATESNNIALLGLAPYGVESQKRHIISSQIEHKSVLEPLDALRRQGFEITLLPPNSDGAVDSDAINAALRKDTLLVSIMHVNNETGIIQPIDEIANLLAEHSAYLHTDAAQGFGKDLPRLLNKRIDLISVSGHKIFGPKGVGALVIRRRAATRVPLSPITYGGGQERGLRPGTLPVALIAGLGAAAELAVKHNAERMVACENYRQRLLTALLPLNPTINGNPMLSLPHVVNLSFPGVDSEGLMLALKDVIAISNGSACTSSSYTPSHVLHAMRLPEVTIQGALRLSWCHMTEDSDLVEVVNRIKRLS